MLQSDYSSHEEKAKKKEPALRHQGWLKDQMRLHVLQSEQSSPPKAIQPALQTPDPGWLSGWRHRRSSLKLDRRWRRIIHVVARARQLRNKKPGL